MHRAQKCTQAIAHKIGSCRTRRVWRSLIALLFCIIRESTQQLTASRKKNNAQPSHHFFSDEPGLAGCQLVFFFIFLSRLAIILGQTETLHTGCTTFHAMLITYVSKPSSLGLPFWITNLTGLQFKQSAICVFSFSLFNPFTDGIPRLKAAQESLYVYIRPDLLVIRHCSCRQFRPHVNNYFLICAIQRVRLVSY